MLKSTAFIASPMLAIFLVFAGRRKEWSLASGHTLMGFLPVRCRQQKLEEEIIREHGVMLLYRFISSMKTPMRSEVQATADSVGKEWWTRGLREAMKIVVRRSQTCELRIFVAKTRGLMEWKRISSLVFQFCNNSKAKDTSAS